MESAVQAVKKATEPVTPNFGAMGLMVTLALSQLYFYINFQGEGFSREVGLAYIIIPPVLLIAYITDRLVFKKPITLDKLRLFPTIMAGFIGFLVTWAFVLLVYGQLLGVQFGDVPATAVWGTVLTQVLFVACSEELAFRYIVPTYLAEKFPRKHAKLIAAVLSSAAFASFHMAAYGGNYQSLLLAFMVSLVWFIAYNIPFLGDKLGLGFTIGSHAAYNLCLAGVLAGNITMLSGGL
jgi:membrane protease YdiL (CAAX protease family)